MLYKDYVNCRKPYQELGYTFLLERKHACLYYKPGKGKTYPCIDAIRDIDKSLNGKCSCLILSTADAINNMWKSEILPQNILPKNTAMLSFAKAIQEETKTSLLKTRWDVIVVDECHKIKSHNTKISKLVFQLSKKTEYVWGLSGTPRGNNDVDIYCQFHNMHISDWGDISYTNFIDQCCDIDLKFFNGNQVKIPVGINKKYKAGWERNIAMYTQRIDYEESDNMPALNVNSVFLPFTPSKEYLQAEDGVISLSDYETTMTKLAAIQKVHQCANGFLYIGTEERQIYHINHNIKLDWLKDNITREQVVVVYRFAADRESIIKLFGEENISYTELVEDFKTSNINVLLLQCSRCESFNLQNCNHIIFYTLDYSFIKYDQMIHRVYRMGQKDAVTIDVLLFENSIEQHIWRTVEQKKELSDLFMSLKGI